MTNATPAPRHHAPSASTKARDLSAAQRSVLAWKPRTLLVNLDGNDFSAARVTGAITVDDFLQQRIAPMVGSHLRTLCYCSGVTGHFTHPVRGASLLTSDVTAARHVHQLMNLGTDSLEVVVEFGHRHGWEVFWSLRMNDSHDAGNSDAARALFSDFKREHPHCLMGLPGQSFPFGADRWSALNYERPEVRDWIVRMIEDVLSRYDIDGVELDFFRHPHFFAGQMIGQRATLEQCALMTDLMTQIRDIADARGRQRGRPVLVSVRVPDSIPYALAIGLDLRAWLESHLIDLLIGAGYFHLEPWESWVRLGQQFDTPVFACLDASRLVSAHRPEARADVNQWRGEALRAWNDGVQGIHLFNRFDPHDPLLREVGDPQVLRERAAVEQETFVPLATWSTPQRWLAGGEQFVRSSLDAAASSLSVEKKSDS